MEEIMKTLKKHLQMTEYCERENFTEPTEETYQALAEDLLKQSENREEE